ncbi:hypothetical protein BCV72DRAFT_261590 [Rhizopus microsporus var. microsporus]|uniref:Uncharacterized protein n=1 Tax=Rhizopus microsporus var. microsporus TaxID=86635 RepID=A0A1X0R8H6_RHIZD|nr:hypothetical protein BCV72DRAFT_261590 [Rhizopus microsporus var. microsporus]
MLKMGHGLSDVEQLFIRVSCTRFSSSTEGIEVCRQVYGEQGFKTQHVKVADNNIHIYCSRESGNLHNSKKRPFKEELKLLLYKSNHHDIYWRIQMICPNTNWPQMIKERINRLVQQKMQANEIRETIKSKEFPGIFWDDRSLEGYILKRTRQNQVTERVQKLIMASSRLCSVAATSEEWTSNVERDLYKLISHFTKILGIPVELLESMIDISVDDIHSDIEKTPNRGNKRQDTMEVKMHQSREEHPNIQTLSIPKHTLFVKDQSSRSSMMISHSQHHEKIESNAYSDHGMFDLATTTTTTTTPTVAAVSTSSSSSSSVPVTTVPSVRGYNQPFSSMYDYSFASSMMMRPHINLMSQMPKRMPHSHSSNGSDSK